MPWYVLYTKPRSEKKTAKLLEDKGVNVYCPIEEVLKQWSDRKKKVLEPVFKSYIFVSLEDYEISQVDILNTLGAVRFLWWAGKPGIVREEEIEAIDNFLKDYKGASVITNIREGQDVRIKEGPLEQQTGKLIKIKGNKAYLEINSIGWRMMAEIPVQKLEKIHHC